MWIDIKDKLPEVKREYEWSELASEPVLVYRARFKRFTIATYESWDDGETFTWKTYDSEQWTITEEVTHWQPLPEAPEV